jgi:20S proteasome alpha/beta subunit
MKVKDILGSMFDFCGYRIVSCDPNGNYDETELLMSGEGETPSADLMEREVAHLDIWENSLEIYVG